MYAAYNRYGDLISDGLTYDEAYWEAYNLGWEPDEFFIVKVTG